MALNLSRDKNVAVLSKLKGIELKPDITKKIDEYIQKNLWEVKENSNMVHSIQGLSKFISSEIVKDYWLSSIYTQEIKEKHLSGEFHIHDLSSLMSYCTGWDLKDLLLRGIEDIPNVPRSKPPKHLNTALNIIVNFLTLCQSNSAGAVALSNFDTYLAPFIYYDNLNREDLKQCLQSFIFNINNPTRAGGETVFSNITIDLKCPEHIAQEAVVLGGKYLDKHYGEFKIEQEMFNEVLFEVYLEGDGSQGVFTFPIPTINVAKDFDWDNPSYNNLWKATGRYGIPYFANFVNSELRPEDTRSMCPLGPKELVLIRRKNGDYGLTSLKGLYYSNKKNKKDSEFSVFSNGSFIRCKVNKFDKQKMLNIVLENGHQIRMSQNHLNFIKNKDKVEDIVLAKDLKFGDYLPFSLIPYNGEGGNPDLAYFVGCFAGDGSFIQDSSVVFSLNNSTKVAAMERLIRIAKEYFGCEVTISEGKRNVVYLSVRSKSAFGLCKDFIKLDKEKEKYLDPKIYGNSLEFRWSFIQGYRDTDGGNRNRIYTSSKKMVDSLITLAATLGVTTSIYKDDRTKEDGKLGDRENFAIRITENERRNYGDLFFSDIQKKWVKIKDIKLLSESEAYCIEVLEPQQIPEFTVCSSGIVTHNCRLNIDLKKLRKGGIFSSGALTGSIGVVTLNMSRLGFNTIEMQNNGTSLEDIFYFKLDGLLEYAFDSLERKRRLLERLTDQNLYPFVSVYLRDIKTKSGNYWTNHFSTIGVCGMHEMCLNMFNKSISDPKMKGFCVQILNYIKEKTEEFSERSGNLYNLEATPAEGVSFRFARIDRKQNSNMRCFLNNKTTYYTNSSQLPVDETDQVFSVLDHQDDLQVCYTGGSVQHIFLGEEITDYNIVKDFIRSVFNKYSLPYMSLTPTFSICSDHGYICGKVEKCPKCGQATQIYSRVVGYLRPTKFWNEGKQEEFNNRKTVSLS